MAAANPTRLVDLAPSKHKATYAASFKTYKFAIPGGVEFPLTTAPVQQVVDQADDPRQVVLAATIMHPINGVFIPAGTPTSGAFPTNTSPFIIVGFREGSLGGKGGAGVGVANAFVVTPFTPVSIVIPPHWKLFAAARGNIPAGSPLTGAQILLSIGMLVTVEPAADGQSDRIIAGFRQSIVDVVPAAILAAWKAIKSGGRIA